VEWISLWRTAENSSINPSKFESKVSDSDINLLYAIKAGIAANKPIAVATRASEIPGATADKVA
jgi:hypothetical protein